MWPGIVRRGFATRKAAKAYVKAMEADGAAAMRPPF